MNWLLLLTQQPSSPSSARVALWRRLKMAGATGVIQGAWILPASEDHEVLLSKEVSVIRSSGGSAALFACMAIAGTQNGELIERFRADRAREYHEFAERSDGFFAEITKETRAGKFSFAELEEIEDDLVKLKTWLDRIAARDFFPDKRRKEAQTTLIRCQRALQAFAESVYRAEGATRSKPLGKSPGKTKDSR